MSVSLSCMSYVAVPELLLEVHVMTTAGMSMGLLHMSMMLPLSINPRRLGNVFVDFIAHIRLPSGRRNVLFQLYVTESSP
eukprot:10210561-Karenia_brevis.AAC.1